MRWHVFLLSLCASGILQMAVGQEQPLKIQVTYAVECMRKTVKGDNIFVHYRGNLTTGEEFDNNKFPSQWPALLSRR